MDGHTLLPVTVIAAIGIFFAREILEAIRRRMANGRKRHALRLLLAAECERNQWFIKWMRRNIEKALECEADMVIEVRKKPAGYDVLTISGEKMLSSSAMPNVTIHSTDKYLFEAASVDPKLFNALEAVAAHLPVLSHLRQGLIEHVADDREWLSAWGEYAREELDDVESSLKALYLVCTGKAEVPHRVR